MTCPLLYSYRDRVSAEKHKEEVTVLRMIVIIAALVSSAGASVAADFKPAPLTTSQVAQIEATIIYNLIDPESARFRNIRAVDVTTNSGKTIRRVCGEVNAKNSIGGYTGFSMFGGQMVNGSFVKKDFFGWCGP